MSEPISDADLAAWRAMADALTPSSALPRLLAENSHLRLELSGCRKALDLMNKGLACQGEQGFDLKQRARTAEAETARLRELLKEAPHDMTTHSTPMGHPGQAVPPGRGVFARGQYDRV